MRPRKPRPLAIVESQVMGRSAVAVVAGCVQVPAVAQLAGVTASNTISDAGSRALPMLWAVTLLLAGVMVLGSYLVPDPGDQRVLEVGGCLLLVAGSVVFIFAVANVLGPIGALWTLAIVAALVVNCVGRAVLLVRQILFVRRVERHAREDSA